MAKKVIFMADGDGRDGSCRKIVASGREWLVEQKEVVSLDDGAPPDRVAGDGRKGVPDNPLQHAEPRHGRTIKRDSQPMGCEPPLS